MFTCQLGSGKLENNVPCIVFADRLSRSKVALGSLKCKYCPSVL